MSQRFEENTLWRSGPGPGRLIRLLLCFLGSTAAILLATPAQQRGLGNLPQLVPREVLAEEGFDASQSAGFFVGISEFEDSSFTTVPFAVDDAVDLASLFVGLELLEPEKVVLALSGQPRKAASQERLRLLVEGGARISKATLGLFTDHVYQQGRASGESGLFIVSIATHGFSNEGNDYLVASDTRQRRIQRGGISFAEIIDDISLSRASRRLVLVDACRERLSVGTRAGGVDPASAMGAAFSEAITQASGMIILSATVLGGFSYDDQDRQNGVFSAAVIDGLEGEAPADQRSLITAQTLAGYVDAQVRDWVADNRPQHAKMSRGITIQAEGPAASMPLAVNPRALEKARIFQNRRQAALENLAAVRGPVISQEKRKGIEAALAGSRSAPFQLALVERLEALDGGESSQRSLVDYLDQQQGPLSEAGVVPGDSDSRDAPGLDAGGLAARSRLLVSTSAAVPEDRFDLPLLLAVQAYQMFPDKESRTNLIRALQRPSEHLWMTLPGHSDPVIQVAWSRDGKVLASASYDTVIRLWDAVNGDYLTSLQHPDLVTHISWSPDGSKLASGDFDHRVRIWEASSGELLHNLEGHQSSINEVAWSPDGKQLASASMDGTLKLWDPAAGGMPIRTLDEHAGSVTTVAWARGGLASGDSQGKVLKWDPISGEGLQLGGSESGDGGITDLAWSGQEYLVWATDEGIVQAWNTTTRALTPLLSEHGPGLTLLDTRASDSSAASSGSDGRVHFAALNDSDAGTSPTHVQPVALAQVRSISFHPKRALAATGSVDFKIRLWDDLNQRIWQGHEDEVSSLAWNRDGTILVSGGADSKVKLWRLRSQGVVRTLAEHPGAALAVVWQAGGELLASAGRDSTVRFWDPLSGNQVNELPKPDWAGITALAGSRDGSFLAIAGPGGELEILDKSGLNRQELWGHEDEISDLAWSFDGRHLASSGFDQTVRIWDTSAGSLVHNLTGHDAEVTAVSWNQQANRVASGGADQKLLIWDPETGQKVQSLDGHDSIITALRWDPSGQYLASGDDRRVMLWDPAGARLLETLTGHDQAVTSLAWSPDGRRLASSSRDKTVKIWEIPSGALYLTLAHEDSVNSVNWSPDGRSLVTASADQRLKIWDLKEEHWIEQARRVVNRNLTRAEWESVLGENIGYQKTFPELPEPNAEPPR